MPDLMSLLAALWVIFIVALWLDWKTYRRHPKQKPPVKPWWGQR